MPPGTWGIGGQVELDFNLTNVTRDSQPFKSIGARRLDIAYGVYDVCATMPAAVLHPRNASCAASAAITRARR